MCSKPFETKCVEIYELDTAFFLSVQGLEWQSCLKKNRGGVRAATDVDMLLMTREGIRGGIHHAVTHQYAKANNKYMKWNLSNI